MTKFKNLVILDIGIEKEVRELKSYKSLILALVVIGAINWGLVGLVGLNMVSTVLGQDSVLEKVVYILVGLAGVMLAWEKWGGAAAKK